MDYKDRVTKFSTKPPGYEAARLRENQRRHRAKVKGRITDLEVALEATQSRLDEALKRIEELTAEVQRLQSQRVPTQAPPVTAAEDPSISQEAPSKACGGGCNSSQPVHPSPEEPRSHNDLVMTVAPADLDAVHTPKPQSPLPLITETTPIDITPLRLNNRQSGDIGDDPNDDCALLRPPSPGESTMRCREAYSMLKDRIMPDSDFDPALVREWLKPGFRRAVCPGDGCRVQTHVLFAFVDHITPG